MQPEKFAEVNDVQYAGEEMIKGVNFAKFKEGEDFFYHYLSEEHEVLGPHLEDVGSSRNKTYGVFNGEKVLVDDDSPYVHINEKI